MPVRELRLVHERRQLRRPMPLRGDLREVAFGGTQELDDAPKRAPLRAESLVARAYGARIAHWFRRGSVAMTWMLVSLRHPLARFPSWEVDPERSAAPDGADSGTGRARPGYRHGRFRLDLFSTLAGDASANRRVRPVGRVVPARRNRPDPMLYLALPVGLLARDCSPLVRSARCTPRSSRSCAPGAHADSWSSWPWPARWPRCTARGPTSAGYFVVNNAVVIIGVVGVANLWAQSGMRARDAAIVGAALAIYDVVATTALPLMSGLFDQVSRQPFAPMVGWTTGPDGRWIGLGLGDLLVLTVFPLVMRKAYGGRAGRAALIINCALLSAIVAHTLVANVRIFPVMAPIGPAMALQYAWWSRRLGPERTTRDYLAAEPRQARQASNR